MIAASLARLLGRPLEVADTSGPADAIVILGAPLAPDGALSAILRERVAAGFALWRAGAAPIVCVTGGPSPRVRSLCEADVMAAELRDLGVPASALRVERASLTTADNARLVAEMLAPEGAKRVWVVTQPFHLRRARWLFRRAGFDALAWRIHAGIQDQDPAHALKWIAREYGAWLKALVRG